MNDVCVVGCGDIGHKVASLWLEKGVRVSGLVRAQENATRLESLGVNVVVTDLDKADSLPNLDCTDKLVYYFVPPPTNGTEDTRLRSFLSKIRDSMPSKFVYISTSGVYGDKKGDWVTEESAVNPETDRSRRRLDAEHALVDFCQDQVAAVILRVGGIYGPGRLPIESIKQGKPVLKHELCSFTNRIHAADLVRICFLCGENPLAKGIYNVSDGHPGTMTQYFNSVADVLGLNRPPSLDWPEIEQVLSPEMLSYLKESRRLDNSKLINELGVHLLYPDLEAGLSAIK